MVGRHRLQARLQGDVGRFLTFVTSGGTSPGGVPPATVDQRPVSVVVGKRKTGRRFPTRGWQNPGRDTPYCRAVGPFEE